MATKLSLLNTMFSICNNVKKRPGWLSTQENSFERIYMKIEIPSSRLCSRQQRARDVRAYGTFYVNSYGNEVKCKSLLRFTDSSSGAHFEIVLSIIWCKFSFIRGKTGIIKLYSSATIFRPSSDIGAATGIVHWSNSTCTQRREDCAERDERSPRRQA